MFGIDFVKITDHLKCMMRRWLVKQFDNHPWHTAQTFNTYLFAIFDLLVLVDC